MTWEMEGLGDDDANKAIFIRSNLLRILLTCGDDEIIRICQWVMLKGESLINLRTRLIAHANHMDPGDDLPEIDYNLLSLILFEDPREVDNSEVPDLIPISMDFGDELADAALRAALQGMVLPNETQSILDKFNNHIEST